MRFVLGLIVTVFTTFVNAALWVLFFGYVHTHIAPGVNALGYWDSFKFSLILSIMAMWAGFTFTFSKGLFDD